MDRHAFAIGTLVVLATTLSWAGVEWGAEKGDLLERHWQRIVRTFAVPDLPTVATHGYGWVYDKGAMRHLDTVVLLGATSDIHPTGHSALKQYLRQSNCRVLQAQHAGETVHIPTGLPARTALRVLFDTFVDGPSVRLATHAFVPERCFTKTGRLDAYTKIMTFPAPSSHDAPKEPCSVRVSETTAFAQVGHEWVVGSASGLANVAGENLLHDLFGVNFHPGHAVTATVEHGPRLSCRIVTLHHRKPTDPFDLGTRYELYQLDSEPGHAKLRVIERRTDDTLLDLIHPTILLNDN